MKQTRSCAKQTYLVVKEWLDDQELRYDADDEKMVIELEIGSDDLPVHFKISVNEESERLSCMSHLTFKVKKDYRAVAAACLAMINYDLSLGAFDYDFTDGDLWYRLVTPFHGSVISTDLVDQLIRTVYHTVDEFNDKLFLVGIGQMNLEQFMEFMKNRD